MARLLPLVRLGLGGTIGTGNQGISWIHEADMNRLFGRALTDPDMEGAYIATAPNPVSQRIFMREMRRAVGMLVGLSASAWKCTRSDSSTNYCRTAGPPRDSNRPLISVRPVCTPLVFM
jgi:NAD dependent epimerase/dehydratase family enzyme